MQKKEDIKIGIVGGPGINPRLHDAIESHLNSIPVQMEKAVEKKVIVPMVVNIELLKKIPEFKPLDFHPYIYATQIHGIPVVVHENGQLLIISETTGKKKELIVKHMNLLVKQGVVEFRKVNKESHFINNQMICDIKKILKVNQ